MLMEMKHYYNIQRKPNADGAQGYVLTACCNRSKCNHRKGAMVALKVVPIGNKCKKKAINQEIQMLQRLQSLPDYVVRYYYHFSLMVDQQLYYVIEMELMQQDLMNFILNNDVIEEFTMKCIYKRILDIVYVLHCLQIAHLDLKPDNFLISIFPNGEFTIKLCDFGTSTFVSKFTMDNTFGTKEYLPFEYYHNLVAHEGEEIPIDPLQADMWALGVVLVVLISKFFPFEISEDFEMSEMLINPSHFPHSLCLDLVYRLLQKDPFCRMPIEEAVNHPWLGITNSNYE